MRLDGALPRVLVHEHAELGALGLLPVELLGERRRHERQHHRQRRDSNDRFLMMRMRHLCLSSLGDESAYRVCQ